MKRKDKLAPMPPRAALEGTPKSLALVSLVRMPFMSILAPFADPWPLDSSADAHNAHVHKKVSY